MARLAGLIDPMARGPWEMCCLWRTAIRPCHARLRASIGAPPHTPLAEALGLTLLPDKRARAA
jgi:hypothetical protein